MAPGPTASAHLPVAASRARSPTTLIEVRRCTMPHIAVLHAIITAAQEHLDNAPGPKPLPAAALFKAYDEILPQHGIDPESDHHLSALVFRVGGEQGGGSLLDKFQSILGRIGIVLEFSDDSTTSPEGYAEHPHPLSPEPLDTHRWYPDDLPIDEDEDAPPKRPRAYSATSLTTDSAPQKIQIQEPSGKKDYQARDDHAPAHTDAKSSSSAQMSSTATRHGDPYHHYPSPLFDHLPIDLDAPDDDPKARLLIPQTDISLHSAERKSERKLQPLDKPSGRVKYHDEIQFSDIENDEKLAQGAARHEKPNPNKTKDNTPHNDRTEGEDIAEPLHYLPEEVQPAAQTELDEPPVPAPSGNDHTFSRLYQERLLTRATRAREIYLASKVFNHWADKTAGRLEREGVARRHMIRFRCFQGWSCAPSLRYPIIENLKALTAVQKLHRAVTYQQEQLSLAASAIAQRHRARVASRVCDQWCSHLVALAYRRKLEKKSKQRALLAWKVSNSSNLVKTQAISRFNRREGIINALSKLQDHTITNSRQLRAARQLGSLQLLFGCLTEWRDQVQVSAQSSAYRDKLAIATVGRTLENWKLSSRVQAVRWRADFISVTRALGSWRRQYMQEEWRRNLCANHIKSHRVSNFLGVLQRSSSTEAQRSHLSNRARLFIVTTRVLPIMDSAVQARKSQMKEMVRQYLMMRYTQVSSARKRRKFYEALDHWRAMTAQATSESDVVTMYNAKYYYGQAELALTKWRARTEEDLEAQLAAYKHYAQTVLAAWGDIARERERMEMQSLELWAARRQRHGQAHTATKVLVDRHNKQDVTAVQLETPTRWTGRPLNMSLPLSAKPLASWREIDEESATSSDMEDVGLQKSPSKPPSNTGRITLPSTTPRGPVPVRLNLNSMRAGTSPQRWSKSDASSKSQPGLGQDPSRGPQSTPQPISKPNFGSSLQRIRSMWQFANLCQWIYIFGDAASIDNAVDVDYIETECLKPNSPGLNDIALALLRLVSSQRGINHASFDDQARKQYLLKSPDTNTNPFGDDDAPKSFADFDVFTKIRVMQQFTQWAMIRPELLREKMKEQKDTEQTTWRIEPYGWDSEDRTYYVLDDNRVYRLTEAPPSHKPAPSKTSRQSRRTGKRRRVSEPDDAADETVNDALKEGHELAYEDTHLGDMIWECVAVTLPEVQALVDSMAKSRDENEKILRKQLRDHLVPILEKQEQERSRRELRREKELATLALMANAKRSSRIASKAEQREQQEKERIEQERLREEAAIQRREEQKRAKIQREMEMRLASREQRLKQREERRVRRGESGTPASVGEDSEVTVADAIPGQSRSANGENGRDVQGKQEEEEAWQVPRHQRGCCGSPRVSLHMCLLSSKEPS
ncbi:Sfi1 spindle body domain-containing protein [Trichoderma gracile]